MKNLHIKDQFNKQAEKFDNWSVGKNIEYLSAYFDFCEFSKEDTLLDVACGPGEFTIYAGLRISEATGVDISDREIDIASKLSRDRKINNVQFHCSDVENIPFDSNSFSIVTCKSAFHHFIDPAKVFEEMVRCCVKGGKISIQDIISYENDYVNTFFETFDRLVDVSHNRTMNIQEVNKLYSNYKIIKTKEFSISVDLPVIEYLDHAIQDSKHKVQLNRLINKGLKDERIAGFLFEKDDELYFKRPVYIILGIK